MKKFLTFLLIGILFLAPVFSATDSATLILKVNIGETALNTGIRITEGDVSGVTGTADTFDNVFGASASTITLTHPSGFVGGNNIVDTFTVLVRKGDSVPLIVTVTPTPLQKPNTGFYLAYEMRRNGALFMNNAADPSQIPGGLQYQANGVINGQIRDRAIFTLTIPQTDQVPIGEYQASIIFTITVT